MSNPTHLLTREERAELVQEYKSGQALGSLLPFETTGGIVVEEINAKCAVCNQVIPGSQVSVHVVRHQSGVDEVRAIGTCCRTATRFLWRFNPDGSMVSLVRDNWYRYHVTQARPAWWDVIGWIKWACKAERKA